MKAIGIKVVFDRKNVSSDTIKGLIQIEISFCGKRRWISTGIKVYKNQYSNKNMVYNSFDSVELNKQIEDMVIDIRSFANRLGANFTLSKLDSFASGNKSSFIYFMRQEIDKRNDISDITKRKQHHAADFLEEYGKIITFGDITTDAISEFNNYLKGKGYTDTTIYDYHKRIRTYMIIAERKGYIQKSPYSTIRLNKGESYNIKYLTEEEVAKIANAVIKDIPTDKARDCFLFQCYTGLAYADTKKFDFKNDVVFTGGRYYIEDKRQKTDTPYKLTLLSPAMNILKKYDYVLPVLSNSGYNIRLKLIATYAGLNRILTTHMARHTFATWALSKGIDIETVGKMLAHKNITTTQIYAKVLQKSVDAAFDKLEGIVK